MKIIFLDIDGVLNNPKTWGLRPANKAFDFECIKIFNTITSAVKADIVITSTWRRIFPCDRLESILRAAGLKGNIRGITPIHGTKINESEKRGKDIEAWLEASSKIEDFVIIDDSDDMEPFMDHLIQTNSNFGITVDVANKVIERLKGNGSKSTNDKRTTP